MKKTAPPKVQRFPAAKQRRLDQLLDKNSAGTITAREKAALEKLVAEAEHLMVGNVKKLAKVSKSGDSPLHSWVNDPGQVASVRQMNEDFAWAMEHHHDLEQQYSGQTVVVWKKQVIAHGTDEEELLRKAANADRPREQLVFIEFPTFVEGPR
jgi:uncharacterized protein DUF5678